MARLPRLVLPELPSHVKAGILSAAMLLLSAPTSGASEQRLPRVPFATWAAETAPERELDRLISEVVARLEQGDIRFSQWRSRDIGSEFRGLRLTVPRTTEGRFMGRNFLFDSGQPGFQFRVRFGVRLKFFVPSACRERVRAGQRVDEIRYRPEDIPAMQTAHVTVDPVEERRLWLASVLTREIRCGDAVRIRLYDSAWEGSRAGQSSASTGPWVDADHNWTAVTILRAADSGPW